MYYIYFAGGSSGTGRGQNFGALQNPKSPELLGFTEEFFRGSLLAWQVFTAGPFDTKEDVLQKMREVYAAKAAGGDLVVTNFKLVTEADFCHAYDLSKNYDKWINPIKKEGICFDLIHGANGWTKDIISRNGWRP